MHHNFENFDNVLFSPQIKPQLSKNFLTHKRINTAVDITDEDGTPIELETLIQSATMKSEANRYKLRQIPSYLLPIADEVLYCANTVKNFQSVEMTVKRNILYKEKDD